jgi:hypothetical protein
LGWICFFSVFDQDQARQARPAEHKKKHMQSVRNVNRVHSAGNDPLMDLGDEAEETGLTQMWATPRVRMDFGPVDDSLLGSTDIFGPDGDPLFV